MVKEYQKGNYCGAEVHEHRGYEQDGWMMSIQNNDTVMNANKWKKKLWLKG
jgi:hypothetical protein